MLVFDPNMRINANEALHHAYFNEYRRQYLFSGLNHFSINNDASANQAMPFISDQAQKANLNARLTLGSIIIKSRKEELSMNNLAMICKLKINLM